MTPVCAISLRIGVAQPNIDVVPRVMGRMPRDAARPAERILPQGTMAIK